MKSFITVFCILFFLATIFTASFAQINWTKDSNNPVMSGGAAGTWNTNVSAASVLYNPDSVRYEMWFDASIGEPTWRPYRTGFATSPDGITWTKIDSAVLNPTVGTWDEYTIEAPMVLRENGQYKMWYGSWSPTTPDGIGYATSPNGTIWTKHANNPILGPGTAAWEIGGASYCYVMPDNGGGYKMWYTGYNASYTIAQIGYATSQYGITWIKADSVNPVLTTGASGEWDDTAVRTPKVIFTNGIYYMWYVGNQDSTYRSIGLARSFDGINWTKYDDPNTTSTLYASSDPVLNPEPGTWDERAVESGTVMLEGDSLRMWYSGSGNPVSSLPWKIGHATSSITIPDTIHVPAFIPTIQAAIDAASDGNVVLVADGNYLENINFKGKAITVASHFIIDEDTSHISNTVIDGSSPSDPDSGSVVYFISGEDTTSVLCGFTVRGGTGTWDYWHTAGDGGGIFCFGVSGVKIINNYITNNQIYIGGRMRGGGLFYRGQGFLILKKNQFYNNHVLGQFRPPSPTLAFGGAVYVAGDSVPVVCVIQDNDFNGNTAKVFGAEVQTELFNKNDTVDRNYFSRKNSRIRNDIFDLFGYGGDAGAVGLYNTNAIISKNTFEKNTSYRQGGAIRIVESVFHINNNIFAKDTARYGGAVSIYSPSQSVTESNIINNTFINNYSSSSGGGIYIDSTQVNVLNSIFWGNSPNQVDTCRGGSINIKYSDVQGGATGTGNIDADPLFSDTLYHLSAGSPCIDSGNPDPLYNDPDGSRNDMGAYGGPGVPIIQGLYDTNTNDIIPKNIYLSQNYPNPFNPITTIEFAIPKSEFVTLKIYNILGQEVATLVSDKLLSGNYKYNWDASTLASGVYMYKIEAGEYIQVKKLILMK